MCSFLTSSLLAGLFFNAAPALAADAAKPACSLDAVTRKCDFFREHAADPKLNLPDGTFIFNPMYVPPPAPTQTEAQSNTKPIGTATSAPVSAEEGGYGSYGTSAGMFSTMVAAKHTSMDDVLARQAEILQILDDTKLSARAKLFFSQYAALFNESSAARTAKSKRRITEK